MKEVVEARERVRRLVPALKDGFEETCVVLVEGVMSWLRSKPSQEPCSLEGGNAITGDGGV